MKSGTKGLFFFILCLIQIFQPVSLAADTRDLKFNRGVKLTDLQGNPIYASEEEESSEYKFYDQDGNEIGFPENEPVFSKKNPGKWCGEKTPPNILVSRRVRKAGLEDIQILSIVTPGVLDHNGLTKVDSYYVRDKDGLTVAHAGIDMKMQDAPAEVWINGIINYVEVYAACATEEGLWMKEVPLY